MKWKIYGLLFVTLAAVGGALAFDYYYAARVDDETTQAQNIEPPPPPVKFIVPEAIELMYGKELLAALRGGGYVLFTRHFHTDHSKWHEDPIKPDHHLLTREDFLTCENQRMLTQVGRIRAAMVGRALSKLQIPIGPVISSPYCRAYQGVELMLGREADETPYGMIYRGGGYTTEMMSDFLRPYLGAEPPEGENTLIMAHRTHMDDIANILEGQMFVFEPLGNDKFNLVGKIFDYEWMEALQAPELLGLTSIMDVSEDYAEETLRQLGF